MFGPCSQGFDKPLVPRLDRKKFEEEMQRPKEMKQGEPNHAEEFPGDFWEGWKLKGVMLRFSKHPQKGKQMVVVGSGLNSPTLFLLSICGSRMNWDEMRPWSQLRFILLGWSWPLVILKGGQRPLLWLSNAGIFVKLLGYLHLLPNHSVMNICTYIDLYIYQ